MVSFFPGQLCGVIHLGDFRVHCGRYHRFDVPVVDPMVGAYHHGELFLVLALVLCVVLGLPEPAEQFGEVAHVDHLTHDFVVRGQASQGLVQILTFPGRSDP